MPALPDADGLRNRLSQEVTSDGHRLGLIVMDADLQSCGRASEILISVGLLPLRRLARLRPRVGEAELRAVDLIEFVERYGHEYAAIYAPASLFPAGAVRAGFEATCTNKGCEIVWQPGNSAEAVAGSSLAEE